jgi:hypothetical protein
MCADAALLYLPVGAIWLLLSRLGVAPLGLSDVIVLLTAVHFHFAGFVVSVFAASIGRAARLVFPEAMAVLRLVAAAAVVGTALVAAGFLVSPLVKVLFTLLYVAGLTGLLSLLTVMLPSIEHAMARRVLTFSTASLFVGVILAGVYGVSEYGGELLISIPQMARFHGVINALGFALCGLLGWTLAGDRLSQLAVRPAHLTGRDGPFRAAAAATDFLRRRRRLPQTKATQQWLSRWIYLLSTFSSRK